MAGRAIPATVISVLLATLAQAKGPTTRPATQPATRPATRPAVIAPQVKPRRERDRMEAKVDGRRAIVDVRSPFGIGQGTIKMPAKNAPESLVLRLYLGGLEDIRVTNGKATLSLFVTSGGRHIVHQSLRDPLGRAKLTPKDGRWAPVRRLGPDGKPGAKVPLKKGGHFEVTLPPALLNELGRDLTVHWVDFYR